jgi:hypothetical protein
VGLRWFRNSWAPTSSEAGATELVDSGAEGARTPDLRHAMAALFQLSYSPEEILVREV